MSGPDAHIRALHEAERSLREPASANDDAGIVTLDVEDLLATRVQVARDWTERGGLEALSQACRQAYDGITQVVVERYFQRIEDARKQHADARAEERSSDTDRRRSGPVTAPPPQQVNAVLRQLTRNLDDLDRVKREHPPSQRHEPPEATEVVGTSDNERVRIVFTVEGGNDHLVRVETDERWAGKTSPLQLGAMIKEAINDGVTRMRRVPRQKPNPYTELANQFGRTADAAAALARRSNLR